MAIGSAVFLGIFGFGVLIYDIWAMRYAFVHRNVPLKIIHDLKNKGALALSTP